MTKILVIDENKAVLDSVSEQLQLLFPHSSVLTAQSEERGIRSMKEFLQKSRLGDVLDILENAEDTLKQRTFYLDKRIKELNCLYSISEVLENNNINSLGNILHGIVKLIPPALRHPKHAGARILFDHEEFKTSKFDDTIRKESFDILVYGVQMGKLEACCSNDTHNDYDELFLEEERLLLINIAQRTGKIIERKISEENLIRLNRSLDMLNECRNALFYTDDEIRLAEKICRIIVEKGGYVLVWVGYLEDGFDKTVRPICQWGYDENYVSELNVTWDEKSESGHGPTGTSIRTGKPCVSRNILTDPRFARWREEAIKRGYASSVSLPLCSEGRCFGALGIYSADADSFDAAEVELLMGLAGDMAYGITSIRNRLERKRSRDFLVESEKRYRTVFNGASDAIFVYHPDGLMIDVNRKACEVLGYIREELVNMNITNFCRTTECNPQYLEELSSDKDLVIETEYLCKDGSTVPVESSTRKIIYLHDMAILTVARDISERKRAEEEKNKLWLQFREAQKRQALGTMASGIAHDFNNILFPIMGYIEMTMDECPEGSRGRKQLSEAMKAANRAKELVRHILTFSRNSSEDQFTPLQIQPLIKETLKLIRSTIPANISIKQRIDNKCGPTLANPTQIHQVLMNLCTNAGHSMQEKGGNLEIALSEVSIDADFDMTPGKYLRLIISDTGHGMTREIMDRIFDPYFTTKQPGQGTGLGLAVVFGIVQSCKGQIRVYSEPGLGTSFHVYLPRIETPQSISAVSEDMLPIPRGQERILLIDDEEMIIAMFSQVLEKLGYKVSARKDSVEALELFRASPNSFDLVITDQNMPKLSGDQLASEIRTIRADIPMILCSGFGDSLTLERAKKHGFQEFIMKPVIKRELAETLRRVLDFEKR